jgi:hypothetical protein
MVCACALVSLCVSACGGETPAPKDADEAKSASSGPDTKKDKDKDTESKSSKDSDDSASATAASKDKDSDTSSPAPASTGSTDLGKAAASSANDVWAVGHQMPPGDVIKTMKANQGKVHACFKAGHKRDPSSSGEVKIKFVVANEGAVKVWKDDGSSMTDPDVTKCVGDLVQTLKFPKQKSPGDAWGAYTANFAH